MLQQELVNTAGQWSEEMHYVQLGINLFPSNSD